MNAASLSLLVALCACARAAPAAPDAAPTLSAGPSPAEHEASAAAPRDKKSAPGTCITVSEPGHPPLTLCNPDPKVAAASKSSIDESAAAAEARFHGGHFHHDTDFELKPKIKFVKVPVVKHVKVPVFAHGYGGHEFSGHQFGGQPFGFHRSSSAWSQPDQRFAYSYGPLGAPDFRASEAEQAAAAAAMEAELAAQEEAQAQSMSQQGSDQARQAQQQMADQMAFEQARHTQQQQMADQMAFEQARHAQQQQMMEQIAFEQARQAQQQQLMDPMAFQRHAQQQQMMEHMALEQARRAQAQIIEQQAREQAPQAPPQVPSQHSLEEARQAQMEHDLKTEQARQAQLEQAMEASSRSALRSSYAPLPSYGNYLPSLPLGAAGGGYAGVFPSGPAGGGCGSLPLLFSCSPQLVRGHLMHGGHASGGYHQAAWGGGYGPAHGGPGSAYRQSGVEAALASSSAPTKIDLKSEGTPGAGGGGSGVAGGQTPAAQIEDHNSVKGTSRQINTKS